MRCQIALKLSHFTAVTFSACFVYSGLEQVLAEQVQELGNLAQQLTPNVAAGQHEGW